MSTVLQKPVIFLTFANDRDDRVQYLRNLPEEARRLRKALEAAEQTQQCEVVIRQNATLEDILDVFQNSQYRGRIAIFHFGGHANGYQLLLESAKGKPAIGHAEGLAHFLGQHSGLSLVFLNGCSTRQQVDGLLAAQIPAVIATAQAIDDAVAMEFASRFYKGLGSGADLQTAYQEAEAAIQMGKGSNRRALYYLEDETDPAPASWPWALYLQPDQAAAQWRLPPEVQPGLELFEEKPRDDFEPEMIYIPAGSFTMGSDQGEAYEKPPHEVTLKAFFISQYPITNRRYLEYVQATGAPVPAAGWRLAAQGMEPPAEKLDHPVVGISWDEARAYCDWLRRETKRLYRLPTEAEWEKAARGATEARAYPWGEVFDPACCNHRSSGTTPVGNYPQGDSPYGCADMAGNIWEWTQTRWGSNYSTPDQHYPYKPDQRENLKAQVPHREYRVIRGGSYLDEPGSLRCSARGREAADERSSTLGFRVVIELREVQMQEG